MFRQPINTARNIFVRMVDATDNETEEISLTLAVTACKSDESDMSPITPTGVTDIGEGGYKIALPASTFDTAGEMMIRVTASGANVFADVCEVYDDAAERDAIAARILTMTLTEAYANAVNELAAAPDNDYRETLAGAMRASLPYTISGNSTLVYLSDGVTHIFTITKVSSLGIDSIEIPTQTS